jgi:putative ABC transport system substrate-binding protein
VEGRNIAVDWRFSQRNEELPSFANELIQLKLQAIVATGGPAIRAIKQVTKTIPIIMAFSGDPVGTGLVASLARPGENLTGLSLMSPDLSAKRLELLKEAFPKISRVATLWNPDDPVYALELQRTEAAARALDIMLQPIEVRNRSDFEEQRRRHLNRKRHRRRQIDDELELGRLWNPRPPSTGFAEDGSGANRRPLASR